MKFTGNPTDLGLNYHTSGDVTISGKPAVRYVLCNKPSQEQLDEIAKYENLIYSPDGATYRYAPEIKYSVLYVVEDESSGEDESFEGVEEEEEVAADFSDEDDSQRIFDEIDSNLEMGEADPNTKMATLTSTTSEVSNLILQMDMLTQCFPEEATMLQAVKGDLANILGRLQGLLTRIPGVGSEFADGFHQENDVKLAESEEAKVSVESEGDSMDEEGAYNWFNKTLEGVLGSIGDDSEIEEEDYPGAYNQIEEAIKTAPYDSDLLHWIWYESGELGDDGFDYKEFVNLCGHYPGKGNWSDEE